MTTVELMTIVPKNLGEIINDKSIEELKMQLETLQDVLPIATDLSNAIVIQQNVKNVTRAIMMKQFYNTPDFLN